MNSAIIDATTGAVSLEERELSPAPAAAEIAAQEVKAEAKQRLIPTDWYVFRAAEGGAAVPEDVSAYRAAVRTASNEIEAMSPIPANFRDDSYWPRPVA